MKIPYKYIRDSIEENPSINDISEKLFQLGHEHEIDDDIFNLEITPNRGDCLSLNGILRDLNVFYTVNQNKDLYKGAIEKFELEFENFTPEFCHKISFLKIDISKEISEYKGVLKNYFNDLDLTKNNFFTDISNYVMFETGQPTHCYDANKIQGKISLKEIDYDLDFETLLGKKIKLTQKNKVFFANGEPINLAGIIGSENSSCSKDTTSIILECAHFLPEEIMGKAVKYDINSEAAHKFERGVDPLLHDKTIRRFIQIVKEHAHVESIMLFSDNYNEYKPITIPFDHNKINNIIGTNISKNEYCRYLERLGFELNNDIITVPSYRNDILAQNDLAEEIARVIGYDNIPVKEINIASSKNETDSIEYKIKDFLVKNGFYEVINFPFVANADASSIPIDNPLDKTRMFLRTNISDSLIGNLIYNERRQKDSIKLYEVSDIYTFEQDKILISKKISIIASGRVGKNYKDFSKTINIKYMKNLFEDFLPNFKFYFKNISRELLDSKLKSEIVYLEIDINELQKENCSYEASFSPPKEFVKYQPISEFPSSIRDISYLIKDPSKLKLLEDLIFDYKDPILKDVFIFDYYPNKNTNEIKIGFRFTFQSNYSTLTVEEVDDVMNNIKDITLKIDLVEIPGI